MNKVHIEVNPPSPISIKRNTEIKGESIQYQATFHSEKGKKYPRHIGPEIRVEVRGHDDKVASSYQATLILQDDGKGGFSMHLLSLEDAVSTIEDPSLKEKI